jgi:hypothetical protein
MDCEEGFFFLSFLSSTRVLQRKEEEKKIKSFPVDCSAHAYTVAALKIARVHAGKEKKG